MPKILVVDDHPTARDFIVTLLGYAGHEVVQASDGLEALGLARKELPDLIITDVLMPTMDGYEFVRQLRNEPAIGQTTVIFYSAMYHDREAAALAEKCGVSHIIRKPSDPEVVIQTIQSALGLEVPESMRPTPDFDREHLRILTDKLSEKVAALETVSSRLEVLIELSQECAAIHDIRTLMDKFSHAARHLLGAQYAAIVLFDGEGQNVEHFNISGVGGAFRDRIAAPSIAGMLERLASAAEPMRERDFGEMWRSRFSANHPLVNSFLGVPLWRMKRSYGLMYAANKVGSSEFADDEKPLIKTLASHFSVHCENIRLYSQLQERASQLEDHTARLKSLSSRLMESREAEQRHIAHELHDEIGQGLSALKIHLHAAQREATKSAAAHPIEESLRITELTLQQVQLLSFDLRPPILDDLGLIPALRWLLDRQAALGGFKTELIADPPAPDVPVDVRTVCFRIVQESLNNIVCHARAAWVSVCLIQDGSGLRLRVSDNGDGFLLSEVRKRASAGGLGLFAMEERANLANGSFTIESVPGSGTTVRVEFPACLRELA